MAHSCPECGLICYCGGDIDDICLDDDAQLRCSHCDEQKEGDAQEDEEGCCFPKECCMPGVHRKSECHTAEMIEDQFTPNKVISDDNH